MDRIVIGGADSIVGSNIAAWLAERYQVSGLCFDRLVRIEGCETTLCSPGDPEAVLGLISRDKPQWLIYCGPGAHSAWEGPQLVPNAIQALQQARPWARVAADSSCPLTMISSDAIFNGPWMFHVEEGTSFCQSAAGETLRALEQDVAALCPQALIVRTHAFGWSPVAERPGIVDQILQQGANAPALDCGRHATPILATDLAEILEQAVQAGLQGVYHVGGGERVSPYRFGALLARQFDGSCPPATTTASIQDRKALFGSGETSLQSRKLREALGLPLPMLTDGLARLYVQQQQGFASRIQPTVPRVREMVA